MDQGKRSFLKFVGAAAVATVGGLNFGCMPKSARPEDFHLALQGTVQNVIKNDNYHFLYGVRNLGLPNTEICKVKLVRSAQDRTKASFPVVNSEQAPQEIIESHISDYMTLPGEGLLLPNFQNPHHLGMQNLYWQALGDRLVKEGFKPGFIDRDTMGDPVEPEIEEKNEERRKVAFKEWRDYMSQGGIAYVSPENNSLIIDLPGRMTFQGLGGNGDDDWKAMNLGQLEKVIGEIWDSRKYNFGVMMNPHTGMSEALVYGYHTAKATYPDEKNLYVANLEVEYVGPDFDAGGGESNDGDDGSPGAGGGRGGSED